MPLFMKVAVNISHLVSPFFFLSVPSPSCNNNDNDNDNDNDNINNNNNNMSSINQRELM